MGKKKDHTGFRNGDLFCFHCGRSYSIPFPQPITMAAALMNQFAKDHKDCIKTWEPPVNESEGKSEVDNANWWLENGERGMSSECMFNRLSAGLQIRKIEISYGDYRHPLDPDDFRRCYLLLKAVPQWKEKIHLMQSVSPEWERLTDNWDRLTEMLEDMIRTKKSNGMYDFMKTILNPIPA